MAETYFPKEIARHAVLPANLDVGRRRYATNKDAVAIEPPIPFARCMERRGSGQRLPADCRERHSAAATRRSPPVYDERHGGFGGAPKFRRRWRWNSARAAELRTGTAASVGMAHDTFLAMSRGGIYDQIGGGLSRYCVDAEWLVPHFERCSMKRAVRSIGRALWAGHARR